MKFFPATAERWDDLERLFGPGGASYGCWCMWWRMRSSEFDRKTGAQNRRALQALTQSSAPPGLLAYVEGEVAAWVSVAPREALPRLAFSRTLQPLDGKKTWSVVCFFVAKAFRKQGMMTRLLNAAIAYAREHGAEVVEGYPTPFHTEPLQRYDGFRGNPVLFTEAGFRPTANRQIMRLDLTSEKKRRARKKE